MIAANPETAILLRSIPFSSMTRRTALERSASLLKGKNSDNIMKARNGISSTETVTVSESGFCCLLSRKKNNLKADCGGNLKLVNFHLQPFKTRYKKGVVKSAYRRLELPIISLKQ